MRSALATVGGLVADLLLPIQTFPVRPQEHQVVERLWIEPGGLGNALVTASRLGLPCVSLGWLGTDWFGDQVVDRLKREGIEVGYVERIPGQSTISTVLIDPAGGHVFLGTFGVRGPERVPEPWQPILGGTPWIMSDGYVLAGNAEVVVEAFALARRSGRTTTFDPGPLVHRADPAAVTAVLETSDILLLTEEEAAVLVGRAPPAETARALLARGPRLVVIKRSAEGSLIATAEEVFSQAAFPVQPRDSTGAGDAFDAAFLSALARGLSIRQAAVLASAVGALAVTKLGTGTSLPTAEEVRAYLKGHNLDSEVLLP